MPLTSKGQHVLHRMKQEYGEKEGERVFNKSKNSGRVTGVDSRVGIRDQRAADSATLAEMNRANRDRWGPTPLPVRGPTVGDRAGGIVDPRFGRRR